jgi:hypothetical protein
MTRRSFNSLIKKVDRADTGARLAALKDESSAKHQRNMLSSDEYQDILSVISRKANQLLDELDNRYDDDDDDYNPGMSGSDMSDYSE